MTREAELLGRLLGRVQRRLAVDRALRWVARTAAVTAWSTLGWALATMAVPIRFPIRAVVAVEAAGLVAGLALLVRLRRPGMLAAARWTDRRLGLADRLSTAVELLAAAPAAAGPGGMARLQIADAAEVAQGIVPRAAAPVAVPKESWMIVACAVGLVLWAQFLQGWTIPGWPAARTAAVIHSEGRALVTIARQLDAAAQTRGLPEARRTAPQLRDLGRRFLGARISREEALGLLGEATRRLETAQNRIERRIAAAGSRGTSGARDARAPAIPAGPERFQQAIRELETLADALQSRSAPEAREDLSRRLSRLSESLDDMNAPASSRRSLEAARRDVELGRLPAGATALGDAAADLRSLERMLGDAQALGEAQRQVQTSADRIARGGPLGGSAATTEPSPAEPVTAPAAAGPNPVTPGAEAGAPPPPGPNQGSLPGEGRGPAPGAPTRRPGVTPIEKHLTGRQGEGPAAARDLLAPGRMGSPRIPAAPVPADVAHENDRALGQEPIPPAYLTMIRRYFETLGTAAP
ncbi:MAG: hypothetical protein E6H00_06385 [Bacillati bacterium ANGP1]|uniref:Uncharacterized protein n=1 Tax=Candidatus Segetimicrobium genomatis TaxID=2569760 RepID=A0A537K4F4_9BACT|nr:MAG: hypothetical protein E6H00_06385 [Terrabacteria group bacterium ANGP1]